MDLQVVRYLSFVITGVTLTLIVYITAILFILKGKIEDIEKQDLTVSDIRKIRKEFSNDIDSDILILKAVRCLENGLSVEQAIKKVRLDQAAVMIASRM